MKRSFIDTEDGSKSLYVHEIGETYHSKFGALQEANFVFIKNGLDLFQNQSVSVLEIGFGTGLNAFVTLCKAPKLNVTIQYTGIEAYPLTESEIAELNYPAAANRLDLQADFNKIQQAPWEKQNVINSFFTINKKKMFFDEITDEAQYDLIYFDAFGYQYQPELWTESIFKKMYKALKNNGVLVTYACRSIIKNNMKAAGFVTEKLPGPPGKREMLRCRK
ncbi:tRNA (5-methylaminomethyl-2-thiouridine)(34)-methyltransferase MnmD [Flavobacterium agricola]|uniref:tRNA (5-methylaminomethyl-2-thiouridine)(34)-methyltransferase MnmD n=1 Tax=Flavobacterium agricola TaxID=2870839 RepID=A0ABY6M0R9_9FLAO|nr:tRNA (5-methylaminomethyl-2-thiouridine)(34)-methyltransferase MnmD [Flavobacterium agricola]UYW02150.1 tRNA (5-methylaminomethyl-2-thiouridine)(34)-methyltransferase MnmD [Flavobacterium agricola]